METCQGRPVSAVSHGRGKKKKASRLQIKNKTDLIRGKHSYAHTPPGITMDLQNKLPRTRILEFKVSIEHQLQFYILAMEKQNLN